MPSTNSRQPTGRKTRRRELPGFPRLTEGSELQKLKAERDTLLDRLARMQADFENARKRAARDQQEFREYALADALKALLPVLDSFERALQAGAGEKSELRNGVELIYKQLQDALGKLGLRADSRQRRTVRSSLA